MALGAGPEKSRAGKVGACYDAPWRSGGTRVLPCSGLDCNGHVRVLSTKTERLSDRRWRYKDGDDRDQRSHPQLSKGEGRHTDESAAENFISFTSGQ